MIQITHTQHLTGTTFGRIATLCAAFALGAFTLSGADQGPRFMDDYSEAVEAATEAGKPVVVVFSASWCPPCQQMKRAVYPSSEVATYHDQFVWAYLDADEGKNREVMESHQVQGIPHIAFLGSDGEVLGQFSGGVSATTFAGYLESVLRHTASTSEPTSSIEAAPGKGSGPKKKKGSGPKKEDDDDDDSEESD
ncbi:MAG: thioredoxin family protein [Verrucomicrobiota bacterium]